MMNKIALLCLGFLGVALSQRIAITSMEEFNTFASSAADYKEVYLETDLDFDGVTTFAPISGFNGTFDGQGHTITNLHILSGELDVGLFGRLDQCTVRNLVIDGSCSVTSTLAAGDLTMKANVGSVVGYCLMCTLESIVNFAPVVFASTSGFRGSLAVGGIAGTFLTDRQGATMAGVANHGAVANALTNDDPKGIYIYTGGLVGYSAGIYRYVGKLVFTDCANYGAVTSSSADAAIAGTGGISGVVYGYPEMTRVLSAGEVSAPDAAPSGAFVGVGTFIGHTAMTACYVLPELGCRQCFGAGKDGYEADLDDAPNMTAQEFPALNGAGAWLHNPAARSVEFHVNANAPLALSDAFLLMPALAPDGSGEHFAFAGWFTDSDCTAPLETAEVPDARTALYGGWKYVLFMDPAPGEIAGAKGVYPKEVVYTHKVGALPTPERTGHAFDGWYGALTGGSRLSEDLVYSYAQNSTFAAQWNVRSYTVTFEFGNGDAPQSGLVEYDAEIPYPADPAREEHAFAGWNSTAAALGQNITRMPAHDITIAALWTINQYDVTFVFYDGNETTERRDYASPIAYPESVARRGYVFAGWDTDAATVPSGGITITALWDYANFTLTFDPANGDEPFEVVLAYNDTIEFPAQKPEKVGFTFSHWEPSGVVRMPPNDFTLTADYATNVYGVGFDLGNGTVVWDALEYNMTIAYPKIMHREGHTFVGWDTDLVYMPLQPLTITAVWVVNNYTVTFLFENPGGKEVKTYSFGDAVVYPSEPSREGYVFYKWDQVYSKMPARNVTIRAQWLAPTRFVSLTFGSVVTREAAGELIGDLTADAFEIYNLEEFDGKTLVMVKFEDKDKAESFYKKLRESSDMDMIVGVDFLSRGATSFSTPPPLGSSRAHTLLLAILLFLSLIGI